MNIRSKPDGNIVVPAHAVKNEKRRVDGPHLSAVFQIIRGLPTQGLFAAADTGPTVNVIKNLSDYLGSVKAKRGV